MKGSILNFNEIRILDVRIGSLSSQKVKDLQKEGIFHGTEKSFIWKNMHKNEKCKKYKKSSSTPTEYWYNQCIEFKSTFKDYSLQFIDHNFLVKLMEQHKKSSFTFCVQNFD